MFICKLRPPIFLLEKISPHNSKLKIWQEGNYPRWHKGKEMFGPSRHVLVVGSLPQCRLSDYFPSFLACLNFNNPSNTDWMADIKTYLRYNYHKGYQHCELVLQKCEPPPSPKILNIHQKRYNHNSVKSRGAWASGSSSSQPVHLETLFLAQACLQH